MRRQNRTARRVALSTAALSALAAAGLAGQAGAVVTTPLTTQVTVNSGGRVVQDVNLFTDIAHTFTGDLSIYLVSPSGTRVPISTRSPEPGARQTDVFAGTLWDDSAGIPVTDGPFPVSGAAPTLTPEGALGRFVGEPADGAWTLEVTDVDPLDTGTLKSWRLDIATVAAAPATAPENFTFTGSAAIPDDDPTGVTDVRAVAATQTVIQDVNLVTSIAHPVPGDLTVRLTSPGGLTETIVSRRGFSNADAFNGTTWDDSAARNVTDDLFPGVQPATPLVPEGALGRFIGTNPNGNWTLRIVDNLEGDTGQLNGWALQFRTVPAALTTSPTTQTYTGPTAIPDAQPDPAPGGGTPGGGTPGTTDPGTTNPGTTNPGTTNPGTTNPGTTNPAPTVLPRVTPRLLGISAPNTVRVRGTFRVVVRFNRAPLGGRVALQRKLGRLFRVVDWSPVRGGRAVLTYRPAKAGRQVLRVRFRVSSGLRYSRPIVVRVRAVR